MEKQDLQIQVMIVKELSTSLNIEIIPEKRTPTRVCVVFAERRVVSVNMGR